MSVVQPSDRFGRLFCHMTEHMFYIMTVAWYENAVGF